MKLIDNIVVKFQNTKMFKDIEQKNIFESYISMNYINFVGDWCLIRYYNTCNECQYDISNIKHRFFNNVNDLIKYEFPKKYNKLKVITKVLIKQAEVNDINRILEFIDITLDYWFYDWNKKEDVSWMINNVDKVKITYEFKSALNNFCKFLSNYHTEEEINDYINNI